MPGVCLGGVEVLHVNPIPLPGSISCINLNILRSFIFIAQFFEQFQVEKQNY